MSLIQRITGKRFEHIYFDGFSVAVRFADGSVLTAYTRVSCNLAVGDENLVTGCTFTDARAEIRLGSRSVIEISMDENDLSGPEFLAFDDLDDAAFVVN